MLCLDKYLEVFFVVEILSEQAWEMSWHTEFSTVGLG